MEELDVFDKLEEISAVTQYGEFFGDDADKAKQIAAHKAWLQNIRHEKPNVNRPYKIGVYIRYFNQTKYDNYLSYHKKQFSDTIALCPKWELVDFLTQKISNVSRNPVEIAFCARMLAAQPHPIGIYFISEDVFTLASYYLEDLRDPEFLPTPDWQVLPDNQEIGGLLHD